MAKSSRVFALLIPVLLVPVLLGGCNMGPNFLRPRADLPDSFLKPGEGARSSAVAEPMDAAWWSVFGDPELTKLAGRIAAENPDVQIAAIRLAESRAQAGVTASGEFPAINANGSYTREKQSKNGAISLIGGSPGASPATQSNGLGGRQGGIPQSGGASGAATNPFDLFQSGFDASWELDIWGRVRRQVESAGAAIDASAETRRDMQVSMVAELARDYLQLRGTQESLRITRANLDTARQSAKLTAQRQAGGLTTELDVANAQSLVNETEAAVPQLEQQQALLINAIGFLLGEHPGSLTAELTPPRPGPLAPPRVPIGLPSELARRRPDIRRAEAQLHAATADIGAAQADFYPRITLSGSAALQALQFRKLGDFSSLTYGFGPSISIPIFEGGRLKSTLELRRLQQREAAVTYQRTVLQAWREVDDALSAYGFEQQRLGRLKAQAANARQALGYAQQRYTQGVSDYLEVLTAQRTLLSAESNLASSGATVNTDLVALYKALGGGWETAFPRRRARAATNR